MMSMTEFREQDLTGACFERVSLRGATSPRCSSMMPGWAKVAKVVLIGGFPSADGEPYADSFEPKDGVMPFPGWGPFEGPDSADLDEEARRSIASAAIPVPEG